MKTSDYDPDLVASILLAAAAPPEATFDNVIDMLNWLNDVSLSAPPSKKEGKG